MSTNPIYVFEHAPTNTLVRAHHASQAVQVLRDGREIARYPAHSNYPVTYAEGRLGWFDGQARLRWVDLDGPLPAEGERGPDGAKCLRTRSTVLAFFDPRYMPKNRSVAPGLSVLDLAGDVQESWGLPAVEEGGTPIWEEFPEWILAPDGETWAALDSKRIVLGRKGQTLGAARLGASYYPKKGTFDLQGRFWIGGTPGVLAVDLAGGVVARWSDPSAEPISAPLPRGDEVWVVVSVAKTTRVARLAAQTGAFLGFHDGFGAVRDPDGQASLLALADGSVAWAPRTVPIRILPAPDSPRTSTADVVVIGRELPSLFPEPDAPWYLPAIGRTGAVPRVTLLENAGARHSLARYLLDQRVESREIEDVLRIDPASFQPFADRVLALDDPSLRAWHEADRDEAVYAAFGASDAAVDALAAALPRAGALGELDRVRVRMLAGVLTPHALQVAADLGRASPAVADVLGDELLQVPEEGPAILRFSPERLEVVRFRRYDTGDPTPGLTSGRPAAEWCDPARGRQCDLPLTEVLTLPADRVPGPLRRAFTFFASGCEECDEVTTDQYTFRFAGAGITLEGIEESACEGSGNPSDGGPPVALVPYARKGDGRPCGHVGGRPRWWQYPEVPVCSDCSRLMFFVGQVSGLRDDLADVGLWGFVCEDCDRGTIVTQMT